MVRDKKKSGISLDTDSIIERAMSLQYVAKELERNQENSKQDTLLFLGVFVAVPVLLALATEVALKAWLYREGKEAPDRRHNLLYLYDDLGEITRKRLEAKVQRCRTQFLNSLLSAREFERHCASIGRCLCAGGTRTRIRDTHFILLSSTTYSLQ